MTLYLKDLKENSTIKILYLDQNMWIYLAQVFYGKSEDKVLKDVLTELHRLIQEKKLRIIINLTNVVEARKLNDDTRVKEFAEFVASLSQMYAFIPFPYIEYFEVDNIIRKELELDLIDIRERAIGKGIAYLISDGNPPKITVKKEIPEDIKRQADEALFKHLESKEAFIEFFLMKGAYKDSNFNETIKELERLREEGYKLKDKIYKRKLGIAQFLTNMVVKNVALFCLMYKVSPTILRLAEGMERIMEVFQNLPLLYTYYLLHLGLDEIPDHSINSHDLQDIYSFCFPLPYCDYVVGERYVISLARRKKIDEIYNTQLFIKAELDSFLEVLRTL